MLLENMFELLYILLRGFRISHQGSITLLILHVFYIIIRNLKSIYTMFYPF